MYVQCERCKSEYEFDDALVSERGTTVKCTHCAHQFKVRSNADRSTLDRWVVKTVSGRDVVFTSLRELQKAIVAGQLSLQDSLARGSGPARLLGSIAELAPFFEGRKAPEVAGPTGTARGPVMVRARIDTLRPPVGPGVAAPPPPPVVPREVSPFANTLAAPPGPRRSSAPPPPLPPQAWPAPRVAAFEAPEAPSEAPTVARPAPSRAFPSTHQPIEMSSPLPPPVRQSVPAPDDEAAPRSSLAEDAYAAPRRRLGGWVLAAGLLLATGVTAAIFVKPYLSSSVPKAAGAAPAPLNDKAQQYVADGDRAMQEGNLAAARASFDKASGAAEHDPRVLLRVARVALALADEAWLDTRLQGDAEAGRVAKLRLDDASVGARAAASELLAATPDDSEAIRLKLDSLRIDGKLGDARALVVRIAGGGPQPESAYVLAMLDLAEPQAPVQYTEIIQRLRLAAASEGKLGRGRAALVYALARSGDAAQARKEIEQVAELPRQPLIGALRSYVDRAPSAVDGGAVASGVAAASAPGVAPIAAGNAAAAVGAPASSDPRVLLLQAEDAKKKGDLDRARSLYESAIAKEPSNSEALAGLAEVAERKGDLATAKASYKSALVVNPGYLPARLGYANALWGLGDKAGAQKAYADIVDSVDSRAYPSYVKDRAEGSTPAAPAPPPKPAPPAPATDPDPGSEN